MKLSDGQLYTNRKNGKQYTLKQDYNGKWYFYRRSVDGVEKTLSQSSFDTFRSINKPESQWKLVK